MIPTSAHERACAAIMHARGYAAGAGGSAADAGGCGVAMCAWAIGLRARGRRMRA